MKGNTVGLLNLIGLPIESVVYSYIMSGLAFRGRVRPTTELAGLYFLFSSTPTMIDDSGPFFNN